MKFTQLTALPLRALGLDPGRSLRNANPSADEIDLWQTEQRGAIFSRLPVYVLPLPASERPLRRLA